MEIYGKNNLSTLEAIKHKQAEKDFYEKIADSLPGIGISKITPFNKVMYDLVYINNNKISLIKFMDTNQDTFDIIGDEIIEILEEEEQENKKIFDKCFPELDIKIIHIMPYTNVQSDEITIIDKKQYKKIEDRPELFQEYMGDENNEIHVELFRYYVSSDLHVIKKHEETRQLNHDLRKISFTDNQRIVDALPFTKEQADLANTINYGTTLIQGASGSGKTTLLFSHAVKMARLYPKDKILYITFDKQLVNNLKEELALKQVKLSNLKIISYHQYIVTLGKKYGLRINTEQKSNFEKEFNKILTKIDDIYNGQNVYKGIFVDEGENFREKDIAFLKGTLYKSKWVFQMGVDISKDLKNKIKTSTVFYESLGWDNYIKLESNMRQTEKQIEFIKGLKNNTKDLLKPWISNTDFTDLKNNIPERKQTGEIQLNFAKDTVGMMGNIAKLIEELINEGYEYTDIAIVYPFNKRTVRKKGQIYSQYIVKNGLTKAGLPYIFVTDHMSIIKEKIGVSLSNIYNISNMEYKIIILCEIDTLLENLDEEIKEKEIDGHIMLYNILYTAIGRATDKVYIYLKEDGKNNKLSQNIEKSI